MIWVAIVAKLLAGFACGIVTIWAGIYIFWNELIDRAKIWNFSIGEKVVSAFAVCILLILGLALLGCCGIVIYLLIIYHFDCSA